MLLIFVTLLFFKSATSTQPRELHCYTTKNVTIGRIPQFTLDGDNIKTESVTADDIAGPPICVIYFGHNRTHSSAWQGHVSAYSLPLDCLIDSERSTYCFKSPNQFAFLELKNGFACCCAWNGCNYRNPWFFQMFEQRMLYESPILRKILPICKYFFCIFIAFILVGIETVLEVQICKWCGLTSKKKSEEPKIADAKTTVEESPSPGEPLKSPMLPSLKLQVTQSTSSTNSVNLSEISLPAEDSAKVEDTQYSDEDIEPAPTQSSELEQEATQESDRSEKIPIPPKPELKMLPSGRMQRTSMNYEESTYSDLQ